MSEALAKVRAELGTDAIILKTRSNRKGGVFDFIGHSLVEVTAAVDDKTTKRHTAKHSPSETVPETIEPVTYQPKKSPAYDLSYGKLASNAQMSDLSALVDIEGIMQDIKELKNSIKVLADSSLTGEMTGLPKNLAALLTTMNSVGYNDKIAKRIIRQLLNELGGAELADRTVLLERATGLLCCGLTEVLPISFGGVKRKIVAFVGPTDTGKTTTIAKLATDFTLNMNKKVSVLTIDTKRIDAVGQLKSYCRIIKIPLHIAYTPDELPTIMPRLMGSDITLVDTPGSGPLDRKQMLDMVEFLQRLVPQEVHLTMSVTTSLGDMKQIFENFGTLKPNRVLYTKLDETDKYGTMISFAITSKKPMSYVTFGQNVPGDFSLAEPEKLVRNSLTENLVE